MEFRSSDGHSIVVGRSLDDRWMIVGWSLDGLFIEHLSKIYRTSIERLSNVYRTAVEIPSSISRTSTKHPTNIHRKSTRESTNIHGECASIHRVSMNTYRTHGRSIDNPSKPNEHPTANGSRHTAEITAFTGRWGQSCGALLGLFACGKGCLPYWSLEASRLKSWN